MSELEIERRFLLKDDSWQQDNITSVTQILQCYIVLDDTHCERVRISETFGFAAAYYTKKDYISDLVRDEEEIPISIIHAVDLITKSSNNLIKKTRYCIERDSVVWEIDIFDGANRNLEIAEVEMKSETQHLILPNWIGKEITAELQYTNAQLTTNPFESW